MRSSVPGLTVELIEGDGGVFDVRYNGDLIFSKKKTQEDRFPEDGEITDLVKQL